MSDLAIQFTDDDNEDYPSSLTVVTSTPAGSNATPAGPATPVQPGSFPEFEKAKVATSEIRISGTVAIDTHGELSVALDDLIRAVGVFRVVKVNHFVNKAGDVVRQQVLAPVEDLVVVPFDAGNANDDGIVRARP